jgi:hypothetical protein
LPGEAGVFLDRGGANFDLGWSWQVPFTASFRHRVAGSLDWVPSSATHRVGGRLGYRYARGGLFAGFGVSLDPSGFMWAPEVGIKLPPRKVEDGEIDPAAHVLVRAEVASDLRWSGEGSSRLAPLRAVTILFGWTIF